MNNISRKQRKLAGITLCQLLSWTLIILIESTSKSLLTATQVFLLTQNKDLGPGNTHLAQVLADESEVDLLPSPRTVEGIEM